MNDDLAKYARVALNGVIVIIALAVFLNLGGCASYGKMYQHYVEACSDPANQKKITAPLKDGSKLEIAQGCSLQAPVDADAKWVNFFGTITGATIGAVANVAVTRSNNSAQKELYKTVGQGGDTITITNNGDSNTTATGGAAAGTAGGNLGNTTTTTTTTTDTNTSTSTSSSSTSASTDGGGSASVD